MAGARSQGPGGNRAAISAAFAALLWLGAACDDPRPRPVPPTVLVTLSTTVHPTSPGSLQGSIYLYDASGLDSVRMKVDFSNGAQLGDSLLVLPDPFEMTLPFHWRLPGGIPTNTSIVIVVRARSYLGFDAADTVFTVVADSS